jgi:formylmethanofuran:tetrahydromethanopterin formyltransferase
MPAIIDDTYAEAFRSIYVEFLITARDRRWAQHAVDAATGNASSTILCDCEAGLDRFVGPGTAGPGRSFSSTCPGFAKIAFPPSSDRPSSASARTSSLVRPRAAST